jgi:hypothetical protein
MFYSMYTGISVQYVTTDVNLRTCTVYTQCTAQRCFDRTALIFLTYIVRKWCFFILLNISYLLSHLYYSVLQLELLW